MCGCVGELAMVHMSQPGEGDDVAHKGSQDPLSEESIRYRIRTWTSFKLCFGTVPVNKNQEKIRHQNCETVLISCGANCKGSRSLQGPDSFSII